MTLWNSRLRFHFAIIRRRRYADKGFDLALGIASIARLVGAGIYASMIALFPSQGGSAVGSV